MTAQIQCTQHTRSYLRAAENVCEKRKLSQGRFERTDWGSITDRNRELVPGRWNRVRERALTAGLSVEGWYFKQSGVCRRVDGNSPTDRKRVSKSLVLCPVNQDRNKTKHRHTTLLRLTSGSVPLKLVFDVKEMKKTVAKTWQWRLRQFCVQQSVSVTTWRRLKCVVKHHIHHKPNFFLSSSVKSEPTWLCPEEPRLEAQKVFLYINADQQPKEACKWKYLHIFYLLRPPYVFTSIPL